MSEDRHIVRTLMPHTSATAELPADDGSMKPQ